MPFAVIYIWELKCKRTYLRNRNRLAHKEKRQVWLSRGTNGRRGRDWGFGDSRCKLVYLGWIDNKVLLCTSPGDSVVKNSPANAEAEGDGGLIPGLERCPGGGNGNPLQYSCLDNPKERGAWWTGGLQFLGRKESDTTG